MGPRPDGPDADDHLPPGDRGGRLPHRRDAEVRRPLLHAARDRPVADARDLPLRPVRPRGGPLQRRARRLRGRALVAGAEDDAPSARRCTWWIPSRRASEVMSRCSAASTPGASPVTGPAGLVCPRLRLKAAARALRGRPAREPPLPEPPRPLRHPPREALLGPHGPRCPALRDYVVPMVKFFRDHEHDPALSPGARPPRGSAGTLAGGQERSDERGGPGAGNLPRSRPARGAPGRDAAAGSRTGRQRSAAPGARRSRTPPGRTARRSPPTPTVEVVAGGDPLSGAVRVAANVARTGLRAAGRAHRRLLQPLPRRYRLCPESPSPGACPSPHRTRRSAAVSGASGRPSARPARALARAAQPRRVRRSATPGPARGALCAQGRARAATLPPRARLPTLRDHLRTAPLPRGPPLLVKAYEGITGLSGMVAYNLLLSIFPLALLALFVFGRVLESPDLGGDALQDLREVFPSAPQTTLESTLDGVTAPRPRRSGWSRSWPALDRVLLLGCARHRLLPHLPREVSFVGGAEALRGGDARGGPPAMAATVFVPTVQSLLVASTEDLPLGLAEVRGLELLLSLAAGSSSCSVCSASSSGRFRTGACPGARYGRVRRGDARHRGRSTTPSPCT